MGSWPGVLAIGPHVDHDAVVAGRRGADAVSQAAVALVGREIERARKRAGLTQEALARALGVGQSLVSDWERGIREPSISQLSRIAHELDVSPHALVRVVWGPLPHGESGPMSYDEMAEEVVQIVAERLRARGAVDRRDQ